MYMFNVWCSIIYKRYESYPLDSYEAKSSNNAILPNLAVESDHLKPSCYCLILPLSTVISHGLGPCRLAKIFVQNQLVMLIKHLNAIVSLQVPVIWGVHFYSNLADGNFRKVRHTLVIQRVTVPFVIYASKTICELKIEA